MKRNWDRKTCKPLQTRPCSAHSTLTPLTLNLLDTSEGVNFTQMINGERKVVAFFSKAVPRRKREWGQTKLEFDNLHASLKHWAVYLKEARQFKVITDCRSLFNIDIIFGKNNLTLVRRLKDLATFNFPLEHTYGEKNYVADFLSRYGAISCWDDNIPLLKGIWNVNRGVVSIILNCC